MLSKCSKICLRRVSLDKHKHGPAHKHACTNTSRQPRAEGQAAATCGQGGCHDDKGTMA